MVIERRTGILLFFFAGPYGEGSKRDAYSALLKSGCFVLNVVLFVSVPPEGLTPKENEENLTGF